MLVTLRDCFQQAADIINTELETHDPNTQTAQTKIEYENIPWINTESYEKKEPYQRYPAFQQQPDMNNVNYVALVEKLKKKNFNVNNGLLYWLFKDQKTIGRKPKTN